MARVGMVIETYFDRVAQDIEGGLVAVPKGAADAVPGAAGGGNNELEVYIFQTRPQHQMVALDGVRLHD